MLRAFVVTHRQAIIDRARQQTSGCAASSTAARELPNSVGQFLAHLSMALQSKAPHTALVSTAIAAGGMHQGRALLALDYTLSQVVHRYCDIGRAITELAMEHHVLITTPEFHTLSCLLDTAIAEAVTEHARLTAESRLNAALERSAMVSREIHGMVDTALVALDALEQGTVATDDSIGAVLAQSLINLRNFVDNALSVVRVDSHHERRERILVATFLDEVVRAGLPEKHRGLQFTVAPVDQRLTIVADPQLLASAVTNLLNNAFKYTHDHGRVTLRAFAAHERLQIEVEDECGGLPERRVDPSQPPSGERRAGERSGRSVGLANARKAVKAQGGKIHTRNIRGKGCVFVIEVPLGIDEVSEVAPAIASKQPAASSSY